ncbi:hypothetical protein M405DRAFT_745310, partial [Rhizopogon salebrosus TDB-379]
GRANSGKTPLLRKVYNATGKSEIFGGKGNKIDPLSTQHRHYLLINHDQINADRGCHDINKELVFRSNSSFVFHDSC